MAEPYRDPRSVAGKSLSVEEDVQLLVIGAGPAGLAAALEAVMRGASVMLLDENPIPFEQMAEDVPLHFGGGMSGAARNRSAMLEACVASEPAIERAFEAGVDVRLGHVAWGLWTNGESVGWLPGLVGAVTDGERSWLVRCDRAVVAAGRRDMGLAFPGWTMPGVMGVTAAMRLAGRYEALAARRAVLLGTGAEALLGALHLVERGITVAALVEQAAEPVGPADLVAAIREAGIPIRTRAVLRAAEGHDGVEAVRIATIGPDGLDAANVPEERIPCDAVMLGTGTVPVVELLDAIGAQLAFRPERGGFVPVLGEGQRTSVPGIYAAGDCAGIWPEKIRDRAIAEREGRRAAAAACASLGLGAPPEPATDAAPEPAYDLSAYRLAWVKASVVGAADDMHVCQCEEVTAREILEVRPPRYLSAAADRRNDRSLRSLLGEGPPHPDQVKRLTRAGMGPCQGRRCREQVAALLALGAGTGLAEVPLAGYRAPVRPLPLRLAADANEPAAMAAEWDTWFGIPAQYRLAAELPHLYTVAAGSPAGPVASE